MKQQIISLLERAKENGATIGDVLAQVREMRPVCLTCDDHGAVGNFLDTVPCPDCTSSPAAPAAAEHAPVGDERAAFEAWMESQGFALLRDGDSYSLTYARRAWAAWQERGRRSALASAPVAGEVQLPWHVPVQHWDHEEKAKLISAPQASPAAQPPQDFGVEMVSMSGTAPAVPRWLLDAAQRIQTYMDAHSPGAWAVGGIQKRQAPAADGRDAAFEAVRKRFCKLPRSSFVVGPKPFGGVQRVDDTSGRWVEFDAAHELFDPVAVDAAIAAQQGEGGGV